MIKFLKIFTLSLLIISCGGGGGDGDSGGGDSAGDSAERGTDS